MKNKTIIKILIQVFLSSFILGNANDNKTTVTDDQKVKANTVSATKEKNNSEIFETMGSCVASCCASGEKMVHKTNSKTKTPKGNKKKRFGWFSR
mgnify:CR=1 FL=1